MKFSNVAEALDACEKAGLEPRPHVTGLREQTYWVHLPGSTRGECFCNDSQFLGWANAYFDEKEDDGPEGEEDWLYVEA